jgi:hypothetical protein
VNNHRVALDRPTIGSHARRHHKHQPNDQRTR